MTETTLMQVSEAIILHPWLAAAPASIGLQVVALIRLRGALRSLSIILTVITGAVVGLAAAAYFLDPGNLWQLLLILATPPMLVLTMGVLLMGLVVGPRAEPLRASPQMQWQCER